MRASVTALSFIMFVIGCGSSEPAPESGSGTAAVTTPTTTTATATTKYLDEGGAMTLADALDQLARSGGVDLVIDPSVSFTAPVDADVRRRANASGSWRAALDLVAASAGCVVEVRPGDGAYVISPAPR